MSDNVPVVCDVLHKQNVPQAKSRRGAAHTILLCALKITPLSLKTVYPVIDVGLLDGIFQKLLVHQGHVQENHSRIFACR